MTPAEATALLAIADRVRRLALTDRRNPERPFIDRDDIAADLARLAGLNVPPPRQRCVRATVTHIEVSGRRVMVQRARGGMGLGFT
jgi:hypothetical protein